MKKYLTTAYDNSIEEVEVLRETKSSVWIPRNYGKKKEKHVLKTTSYHQYHDTWEQAYEYLLAQANDRISRARRRLIEEMEILNKILAMKENL